MDTYALHDLGALLGGNPYHGRGIVVGKSGTATVTPQEVEEVLP